jgi:uncharacterized lipoprotein YddW (UPF0748 family)
MRRARRVTSLSMLVLAAAGIGLIAGAPREVRGLWVVRTALVSPASVSAMVDAASRAGVNTLIVQVRGRGDAYYASRREPRAAALSGQPASFDPLALVLREAHVAGITVHAWVNVNLVADAVGLPASPGHLANRHPEWLMVPSELAATIGDPKGARFVRTLASWTRGQSGTVEGLFLSPVPQGAADHLAAVVQDLVSRYAVDGVHFDYVRYPGASFDYGRETLRAFQHEIESDLSRDERASIERRRRANPLVVAQMFPQRWDAFRRARMTALLQRLSGVVRRHRPGAVVSAAVFPDPQAAVAMKFQDWPGWVAGGGLDAVCPMTYTTGLESFRQQVEAARAAARGAQLWAGIGAYRLSADDASRQIQEARALGVDGVLLFSYDSLVGPARGPDTLSRIGAQAFGQ